MIVLEGICKKMNGLPLLEQLDLNVNSGSLVIITGPSGSGKTTILRLIAGLDIPDKGIIHINGTIATNENIIIKKPFERNIGMVFQDFALWPHLTVENNIRYALRYRQEPVFKQSGYVDQILSSFGIVNLKKSYPAKLSGGERQRVALARALAPRPSILLLDEPVSNLDDQRRKSALEEIERLQNEINCKIVIVTHTTQGMDFSNARCLVLENRRLIDA